MSFGRPRDVAVDAAARRAVVALIVDRGYARVTMGEVARAAGFSKAALYRRWPNKLELAVDAVADFMTTTIVAPDTGHVREDVIEFMRLIARTRQTKNAAHTAVSAALQSEPELRQRCKDTLMATFTAGFEAIVLRGMERGELPADTDVELLAQVVPALARSRAQTTGWTLAHDEFINRVVDQFFGRPPATPARRARARLTEPAAHRVR